MDLRNEENTSKLTSRFSNLSIWVNGNAITQDVEYSRKSKGLDWERGAGGPSDHVHFESDFPLWHACGDAAGH